MADLTTLFEPLTGKNPQLASIDVVAFDIFGTLIGHRGDPKEKMLLFAHYLRQSGKVDIAFVSTQPDKAVDALMHAGCQLIAVGDGVQLKDEFYKARVAKVSNVLAIDDEAFAATRAAIHIDPNNVRVKKYIDTKAYRFPSMFTG